LLSPLVKTLYVNLVYTKCMAFLRAHSALAYLYATNFLFALHSYIVAYVGSSFLAQFLPDNLIGLTYVAGAAVGLLSFAVFPHLLRHMSLRLAFLLVVVLEVLVFMGLTMEQSTLVSLLLFIAYLVLYPLGFYCLDVLLERLTKVEHITGTLRGIMLTTMNAGLIVSPLLAGSLLVADVYNSVFLAGALILVPVAALIVFGLPHTSAADTPRSRVPLLTSLSCVSKSRNVRRILSLHLLLHTFFAFMVIYMPLYLHEHIGFSWPDIGLMLAVALLPYVLIEFPAGRIADRYIGEKEMLILGFIIAAGAVTAMALTESTALVVWGGLLFMTRVGAALIESMSETYFFKKVSAEDTHTISFFRMIQPVSYLVGPALGTAALFLADFQALFLTLAGLLALGVVLGNQLIDTR